MTPELDVAQRRARPQLSRVSVVSLDDLASPIEQVHNPLTVRLM